MKKISAVFIAAAIFAMAAIPSLAAAPVDIQQSNINGKETLVKVFELNNDEDPNMVIEQPFEKDGFIFNLETIRFEEVKRTLTKDCVQAVSVVTQSDNHADILRKFSGSVPYTDEAGYAGTLYIDTGSIVTEVESYEAKWYTVTDTKEFTGMTMNDPSGIPQSTVKSGVTLGLADISWIVTETALAGDSLVPVRYKAVASYSGKYSKQVPTGYVTTASYRGELTLEVIEKLVVQITYIGTQIPSPPTESLPPADTNMAKPQSFNPLPFVLLFGAIILGGAGIAFILMRKAYVKIFCLHEGESKNVGKMPLDVHRPVIDLSSIKDQLLTLDLSFLVDKRVAAKLDGKRIAVLLDGDIRQHAVDHAETKDGAYIFCIDFGGTQ